MSELSSNAAEQSTLDGENLNPDEIRRTDINLEIPSSPAIHEDRGGIGTTDSFAMPVTSAPSNSNLSTNGDSDGAMPHALSPDSDRDESQRNRNQVMLPTATDGPIDPPIEDASASRYVPLSPAERQMLYTMRVSRRFCLLLAYPFIIFLTILGLIIVLIFCILPTLFCVATGICAYYCCIEDPLPLPILLRYIFTGYDTDERHQRHNMFGGFQTGETFQEDQNELNLKRDAFRSSMIIRKLLKVENLWVTQKEENSSAAKSPGSNDRTIVSVREGEINLSGLFSHEYPRDHPFPIQILTESKVFFFSNPLEVRGKDHEQNENSDETGEGTANEETGTIVSNQSDENSDEGVINIPHYQRIVVTQVEDTGTSKPDAKVEQRELNDDASSGDVSDKTNSAYASMIEGNCIFIDGDDYDVEDGRDRGTTCDICLLEFENGDEVAWSPNLKCSHTFHSDCILDWLVRKPTCPSCRQDYVKESVDDD